MLTVLVVSGGGFQGHGIIAALRDLDVVRVVVVDSHEDNPGRHLADAFHAVPALSEGDAFGAALVRIAALEGVGLVLPATALELMTLARAAPALEASGVRVAVCGAELLRVLADKRILYAALEEAGFPVLPTVDPRAPGAAFPLVGKPAAGWGSQGVFVAESAEDLAREWSTRLAEEYVWQPRADGEREVSVDFAIDFAGRVSVPAVRARLRTSGGFAVVSETAASGEAEDCASRFAAFAKDRGGLGAFNLQFLEHEGRVVLSDVNPRLGTSAVHWRGTDRDPVFHLCRSVDPSVSIREPRKPIRTVRVLGDRAVDPSEPAEQDLAAIVFDLDDTLVPHKRWMLSKLEAVWQSERAVLPEREAFFAEALRIVEEGPRSTLLDALGARFGWTPERVAGLVAAYRAASPPSCPLHPDVLPALATLRGKGYRLAVLTDNPPESQKRKIAVSGLAASLDHVVYAREHGGDKPAAAAFAAVAAALGLPASALAMVGDNPYRDGLGALAAGYGAAFVIARAGAFFNFDPALPSVLPGAARLRRIESLSALAARLPEVRRPGSRRAASRVREGG